jgi:hypothetical protein
MSTHHEDYIPRKDSELVPWSANFTSQIETNAVAWSITTEEVAALRAANNSFAALHAKADSPASSSIVVEEKNAARAVLEGIIRTLAGFRLKNPIITDANRTALGLHIHDTTPSNIPVPTTRPEIDIDVVDFRRIKVIFHDMGSDSNAKPYGINGAVIIYAVLDAPPADHSALTRSVLATRTPHVLEFPEEDRGKTVYVAICWQNEKGEKGPFSGIESAIVP